MNTIELILIFKKSTIKKQINLKIILILKMLVNNS